VPEGAGGSVRDRHRAHRQPNRRSAGGAGGGRGRRRLENRVIRFPRPPPLQQNSVFTVFVISRRSVSEAADGREFYSLSVNRRVEMSLFVLFSQQF